MALPRSKYVKEGQEGVYHCFTRCVRRAFLCGHDPLTHQDYSHRKELLVNRMRHLAAIFAVEVCAYVVMANHYHTILRTRPDWVVRWTDREVAMRWLQLFPKRGSMMRAELGPTEEQICALASDAGRVEELRRRLSSLSWFMGRLNEYIARTANKEDGVKGRFWESRFKCQTLLDEGAIAACMVYVDLNPVRAGLAATLEESDFTSIQERIRSWSEARTGKVLFQEAQKSDASAEEPLELMTKFVAIAGFRALSSPWLCPIGTDGGRRGILPMTLTEYIDFVDRSGRLIRSDKKGVIDQELKPILERIGANKGMWKETIGQFGSRFHLAAGSLSNLRDFAAQLGKRWITGIASAQASFLTSSLQSA